MHAPGCKAIGLIHADVKVGGVVQRDPVEHQTVGMAGDDHARRKVALVLRLCLTRHLPPAIVLAEDLRIAASIDNPVAHDADILRVINTDEWSAPSADRCRTLRCGEYRWRRARCDRAAKS